MLSHSITYILLDYAYYLGYIKEKYANKTQTVSEKNILKMAKNDIDILFEDNQKSHKFLHLLYILFD